MMEFCGHEPPVALYTYDNWTHQPTSEDQKCVEKILPRYVKPGAVWLHIGIGNSSLAKKFAAKIGRLDGITVCKEEIDTAPKIPNYAVRWCDKHSADFLWPQLYDVIIDTTPAGHACCKKHLEDYFGMAFQMLQGAYLTDKAGLAWAQPTSKGMTPDELGSVFTCYGLKWQFVSESVIEARR